MHAKKIVSAFVLALALLSGGVAYAQTDASSTITTTPGVPNTGAGGDTTTNLAVLGASALIAIAGGAYLLRKGAPQ